MMLQHVLGNDFSALSTGKSFFALRAVLEVE